MSHKIMNSNAKSKKQKRNASEREKKGKYFMKKQIKYIEI